MLFEVKVQPKSKQNKLVKINEGKYKAFLKTAPVNNKANEELLLLVAQEFKLKRYDIEIVRGLTSRNKVININK